MKITTCRLGFVLLLVLTLRLPYSASASPATTQCPSQGFDRFLIAFSTDLDLQSVLHARVVRRLTLTKTADGVVPYQPLVDSRVLHFPLMKPAEPTLDSVVLSPDGQSATYTDKRAGLGNIKVYTFQKTQTCWSLTGIEDWSVPDSHLKLLGTPGMFLAEQRCAARADIYGQLGGPERYPLTAEFYQASEEYWVCAAASGNPEASLAAASLSMSEMAPELGLAQTEKLYRAAAKTTPDAWALLASISCDGADPSYFGPCKAPQRALAILEQAAASSNPQVLDVVGDVLSGHGDKELQDQPRALACYRAAVEAGSKKAQVDVDRLQAAGVEEGGRTCL